MNDNLLREFIAFSTFIAIAVKCVDSRSVKATQVDILIVAYAVKFLAVVARFDQREAVALGDGVAASVDNHTLNDESGDQALRYAVAHQGLQGGGYESFPLMGSIDPVADRRTATLTIDAVK